MRAAQIEGMCFSLSCHLVQATSDYIILMTNGAEKMQMS